MKRLPINAPSTADIFHKAQIIDEGTEEMQPEAPSAELGMESEVEPGQTPGTIPSDISASVPTIEAILKNYEKLIKVANSNMEIWKVVRSKEDISDLLHDPNDPSFDWDNHLNETENLVEKASQLSLMPLVGGGEDAI